MSIPKFRTDHQTERARVSPAVAELVEAETLTRSLVDREARSHTREVARQRVARAVGASPGTIENLDRGRLRRSPGGWLRDALKARVVRGLEGELLRLRHEQHCLLQSGANARSGELEEVDAGIAKVLAALGRKE